MSEEQHPVRNSQILALHAQRAGSFTQIGRKLVPPVTRNVVAGVVDRERKRLEGK